MAKYYRSEVVDLIKSWKGLNEKDGSHKKIIDIYNKKMPDGKFPRGLKMQYDWAWCACTWSALALELGYTDIMPVEISVNELVLKAQRMGIWVEDDAYVPNLGDGVVYDWGDSGVGDNKGYPDHIGTVISVDKTAKTFAVMEGNYKDSVKERVVKFNGKNIRGFICPRYDGTTKPKEETKIKIDVAASKDLTLARTYKVTNDNKKLMSGPSLLNKTNVCKMPKGTKVQCYGYYTEVFGKNWLLVQTTINGVTYTGFCTETNLKEV